MSGERNNGDDQPGVIGNAGGTDVVLQRRKQR